MLRTCLFACFLSLSGLLNAQGTYQIALLKYNGGGDWYANPTSLPNLVKYCNDQLAMNISTEVPTVEVSSPDLFTFPLVHMTGHGNVVFNGQETENLRNYLIGGGFLHISDNYGMDPYIRPMMKRVFPELEFVECYDFTYDLEDPRKLDDSYADVLLVLRKR